MMDQPKSSDQQSLFHSQQGHVHTFTSLIHRDSEFSVTSEYVAPGTSKEGANNDVPKLNAWQGATLLTADCLGTGLLALPDDIRVLGAVVGLGFLILNLPINFYAGYIFHKTASAVESQQEMENRIYHRSLEDIQEHSDYESFRSSAREVATALEEHHSESSADPSEKQNEIFRACDRPMHLNSTGRSHSMVHHDTATSDFIGMASALFFQKKGFTRFVMAIFYINIFLVLGNYILVMSHALSAAFDGLCLPTSGGIATFLMIGVTSQMRTMAKLGRLASVVSLLALAAVVGQCLWAVHHQSSTSIVLPAPPKSTFLRKLSALGSIGFAVGSQKLFLNIRHDLSNRDDAPKTLAISLSVFGLAYVGLCLGAGSNPPGFLLDAIPESTWSRRIAGLLLFVHVIVSYAINSQALCSSLDRLIWRRLHLPRWSPRTRWFSLTTLLAVTAYTVANAIPFFTDLIAFIGAISTVPLTLLLPALYWRKQQNLNLWSLSPVASASLTYFALVFAVLATVGSMDSILRDWSSHGPPFSCQ